jgi:isocitrate dehydrogenase kinase/phosphatase
MTTTPLTSDIARTILGGFDKHYRLFREAAASAKDRFERADWVAVREASAARIAMYDQRVVEAVSAIFERFPEAKDESLWPQIKMAYIALLTEHAQPECAETFYNSVACRVLHRRYYRNEYIFYRPAVSTEHLAGEEPAYRCYYPKTHGLRRTAREIVTSFGLKNPFRDLGRDIVYLMRAVREHFPGGWEIHPNFQFQLLSSLFFRNKAAYIVGRAVNGNHSYPFVVPILQDEKGLLYLDALLLEKENIGRLFSLARAYFMVDMEVPSAYVRFLQAILPNKPKAELYTLTGLQKQGKTLFFRDLKEHLQHSTDSFVTAAGTKGMVMVVFTLPSFPYVFKVIRDWFPPPKDTSREKVVAKYLLVKRHDRVGRLADTLEYSNVAFPRSRFEPALLDEIERLAGESCEVDGDQLVIKHLYIERRMVPLDVYVQDADDARLRHGLLEYGNVIKELAGANIFPGDLLLKNFGVTRYGRVVFYDYDELCLLSEVSFRRIPRATSYDDEVSGEPWYSVGPNDVFPEELPTFLFSSPKARDVFLEYHADLVDPQYWIGTQERIKAGVQDDLFPYPEALRFSRRFAR